MALSNALGTLALLVCLYHITAWAYNLLFHPLAKFPGPFLWRVSRIPYLRAVWGGRFPYKVKALHEAYGEVVRVAPDELSFATAAAWDDIYANRTGANSQAFPKSELWHGNPSGGTASVHFLTDVMAHSRVRRLLSPAFSEKAVLQQEPILQKHVDLCLSKLHDRSSSTGEITINIVDWLNFTLFDVVGDLAYGETFGCLDRCEYEDWMNQTSASVRAQYFTIHLRHYPRLKPLLTRLFGFSIPPKIMQQRIAYRKRTAAKMERRLAVGAISDRPDMVAQLLQSKGIKDGLTEEEILVNSILFISAASETTATTLMGALNHLLRNPRSLARLEQEIRALSTLSELKLAALRQMPYLDAVLRESLRMCNPNPIGHMRVTPPGGGRVAGHWVPGDTLLTVQPLAMSFSQEYFYDPTGWHPERWLAEAKDDPSSVFFKDERKASRAFGVGPYNCIGEPLGWAWMRVILTKLIWAFDLGKADTPHADVEWDSQEVYATVVKKRFDIKLVKRSI